MHAAFQTSHFGSVEAGECIGCGLNADFVKWEIYIAFFLLSLIQGSLNSRCTCLSYYYFPPQIEIIMITGKDRSDVLLGKKGSHEDSL